MGRYRVETPDGQAFEIEGPDGATDEQLHEIINQQTGGKFSGNPVNQGAPTVDTRPTSFLQGVGEGAKDVLDHAADWVEGGLDALGNAVGAGNLGQRINSVGPSIGLAGSVEQAEQNEQVARSQDETQGSGLGRFVGELGATLPLAALPGGVLAQGAAGGALLSDADSAAGVAMDATIGAAGGAAGSALFRGAAKLAAPVVNDSVRTLINAGVRVTPGQAARGGTGLGSRIVAAAEDRASGLPFVGDAIERDRARGIEGFNAAAINRTLEPIGLSLPDGLQAGRRAIKFAGDKLSEAYDALLPSLRATGDGQFADDLARIHADSADMHPDRVAQFNGILEGLGRYFRDGVELDGQALKAVETRLGEKARKFTRSTSADEQELGDALNSVLSSVRDLAARQNPEAATRLQAINKGWAGLVQVERAGLNTKGQFAPGGYSQAVRATNSSTRGRGYARGEALNQDLSDAASDILPSQIADSGTSGRLAQASGVGLLAGLAQKPIYEGMSALTPYLTRQTNVSPGAARFLQYGAQAAPIAAPALLAQLRDPGAY